MKLKLWQKEVTCFLLSSALSVHHPYPPLSDDSAYCLYVKARVLQTDEHEEATAAQIV